MDEFIIRNEQDRAEVLQFIKHAPINPLKPKKVVINTPRRSLKQNGLYWAWITEIATFWNHKTKLPGPEIMAKDQQGNVHVKAYTKDNVHKWFARLLLPAEKVVYNYPNGDVKYDIEVKSTSEEDSKQFSEYMMKVRMIMMNTWDLVLETPEGNEFTKYLNSLGSV